jgi:electron transport complex protein RnfE
MTEYALILLSTVPVNNFGSIFALVLLGALREAIGQGTLLAHADLMFGAEAKTWTITLVDHYRGFLLAILPPGAFIGLGLLIAVKNVIDQRLQRPAAEPVTGMAQSPA